MKRSRITVMWMPSAKLRARIFSIPPWLLYTALSVLAVSVALVLVGGAVVGRLYYHYVTLERENSYLLQQKAELDALSQAMERIQQDEQIIRSFLGLDRKHGGMGGGQGQGGEPSPDLRNIAPDDSAATSTIPPVSDRSGSLLDKAHRLQTDLQELVVAMRDQRILRDSMPSIVPVLAENYWFSSGFGWRRSPFTGLDEFHNGLDISSPQGTPIVAPGDGIVTIKAHDRYLGNYIEINHGRGITTLYGHLSGYKCNCGQRVRRGEIIAYMGNTGLTTGHHLHYTVKVGGRAVSPLNYILNARANPILASANGAEGKKE
ncbi:MAG TPA: M23 family metallopeptidase [Syntrophobacteria bacterium]|nr:M23 family metallopeptidase [Syntrophobacteria bacterium]